MKARLLILGMLHRGDLHPYEMKRRLEGAMVDCYIDVDVGTLYYAIRQLEKDGGIEAVARERVMRGGMRTIYRITDKGRAEFQDGFFRQFEDDGPASQALYGPMLFLHCVDREKLMEAIRKRIARLDDLIVKLGPIREQMGPSLPTGADYLFRHIGSQRQLDQAWLIELLETLETER